MYWLDHSLYIDIWIESCIHCICYCGKTYSMFYKVNEYGLGLVKPVAIYCLLLNCNTMYTNVIACSGV